MLTPVDISSLHKHVDFGYFHSSVLRSGIVRTMKERLTAWELAFDYYDGKRCFGYGGFKDDKRWQILLPRLLKACNQNSSQPNFSLLDLGCKKGFIVEAARQLGISALGVESHNYPIVSCEDHIRHLLVRSKYTELPFENNSFDFVIAFSSIYMLNLGDIVQTLREIMRVSTCSFISVAAYNEEWELDAFKKWTLLGTSCFHCSEWLELFHEVGFNGYYFFTTPSVLGFRN